jgi:glycosyltransferase involved in cell wall biosynthesis
MAEQDHQMRDSYGKIPSVRGYIDRAAVQSPLAGGRRVLHARPMPRDGLATVVTVTFNSRDTIDRTIDSVVAQTYGAVEYIIVDGNSTDGTLDRLRARSADIDVWISEPDDGISDAFNKGIAMASGEYVAIVNSDDWLEPEHLSSAIEALSSTAADFVFGDIFFYRTDGKTSYRLIGEERYSRRMAHSMPHINHPTVVCRRAVYEEHGLYSTGLAVAMDYEWLLRGFRAGVRGVYAPRLLGHVSLDGVSDRRYLHGYREVRDVSIRYGYPVLLAWLRYLVRCSRTRIRRTFRDCLPMGVYDRLRRAVNPHYRSVGHHPVRGGS